jgi:uncharacterized membrane protein YbaN (DUF454 family)
MSSESRPVAFDDVTTKLIACAVIVACLVIGGIGLLLPIVPGLLFIAIAGVVAAKLSPQLDQALRRNKTLAGYLDRTDGFIALPLGQKVRVAGLLAVRMLVDGVALLVACVMRVMKAAGR